MKISKHIINNMVSSLMLTKDDIPESLDKIEEFERQTEEVYNFLQKQKGFYKFRLLKKYEIKDDNGYNIPHPEIII